MIQRYACDHVALSLPSLRAGTLTPALMKSIKAVRKTGFTIAPEAGSQRLRDVINKNITDQDIRQTVQDAFGLGWKVIKLYFMIGLPTETREDLEALVKLVRELSLIKGPGGKKSSINVSVATLIPKPHTPFQWAPQISVAEGWEKIQWIKQALRSPRIRIKWQNPEVSYIEGLMARGDRRMADLIEHAYRKGCRLDGWSDHFRFDLWEESIRDLDLDAHVYVHRPRAPEEVFPWDHIDMKVSRAYLWDEWQKALQGGMTEDCRDGECQNCGVCDFTSIQPRVFPDDGSARRPEDRAAVPPPESFRQFQLTFAKTGGGRFWGHLEMVNIFIRALRRSGITVKFSEGFHPKPKMAFSDALPIGLESLCETMLLTVSDNIRPDELVAKLNRELPDGLRATDCLPHRQTEGNTDKAVIYRVTLHQGTFDAEAVERFKAADNVWIERTNRKGKLKKIDLKAMVQHIQCVTSDTLELVVHHRPDALLRPDVILQKVFALSSEAIRQARVIKLGYRLHKGDNASPTA